MGAYRFIPQLVDAQFWKLSTDALPEGVGEGDLFLIVLEAVRVNFTHGMSQVTDLEVVDVNIEPSSSAIADRLNERLISLATILAWRVVIAFCIGILLTD